MSRASVKWPQPPMEEESGAPSSAQAWLQKLGKPLPPTSFG